MLPTRVVSKVRTFQGRHLMTDADQGAQFLVARPRLIGFDIRVCFQDGGTIACASSTPIRARSCSLRCCLLFGGCFVADGNSALAGGEKSLLQQSQQQHHHSLGVQAGPLQHPQLPVHPSRVRGPPARPPPVPDGLDYCCAVVN